MRNKISRAMAVMVITMGLASFGACSGVHAIPNHPGAVNPVDNALYDGILTTRAGIESAKVQFAGSNSVLVSINAIIPAFNKLEAGYSAYHTALVAGKADPAQLTNLQTQLSSIQSALASVLKVAAPAPVK